MSLTYDGIIHRSLEEQVRYDAEQVQILKQADVTINENLQTVNTEIDGKLTKPTNPSTESAVTMLADGTVSTKPLSEIGGGGGGKLYLHKIGLNFKPSDDPIGFIHINIYKSDDIMINTLDKIIAITSNFAGVYDTPSYQGVVNLYVTNTGMNIHGVVIKSADGTAQNIKYLNMTVNNITDNVVEL